MNLLFRFFSNIFKNLILKRPMSTNDVSIINFRVLPTDLDLNFHMNNGRYLTIMDIGRTEFLIRFGMLKIVLSEKLSPVAGGVNIIYFKALNPFDKYQLQTSLTSWDDHWFYLKQDFVREGKVVARAIAKVTFLKKGKKLNTTELLTKLNHTEKKLEFPSYLNNILEGEKKLINEVKEFNKVKKA
jgi:acyl-CoA thioesterase FadM